MTMIGPVLDENGIVTSATCQSDRILVVVYDQGAIVEAGVKPQQSIFFTNPYTRPSRPSHL